MAGVQKGWIDRRLINGLVAMASVAVLGLAVAVAWVNDVPFATISRDMFATAEVDTWTGLLSNVGVVIWSGAGCVALFAAAVVTADRRSDPAARLLLFGGVLSGLLAADDLFLLHENGYFVGVPERVVLAGYGVAVLAFLVLNRRHLLDHPAFAPSVGLLVVALGLFAVSLGVDVLQSPVEDAIGEDRRILAEDGAKFLGIAWWSAYFVSCSFDAVLSAAGRASPAGT